MDANTPNVPTRTDRLRHKVHHHRQHVPCPLEVRAVLENVETSIAQKLLDRKQQQYSVLLFVRLEDRPFGTCGVCSVSVANGKQQQQQQTTASSWELVELCLELLDWDVLKQKADFRTLLRTGKEE